MIVVVAAMSALMVLNSAVRSAGYTERATAVILILLALLVLLVMVGYSHGWTGFGESVIPKAGDGERRPRKTLWDWMQLLVVPIVLAVGGFFLSVAQEERQQAVTDERARAAALQGYLDQMGVLLIDKNLGTPEEKSGTLTLARARTLTVLEGLGPNEKRDLMRFLYEAKLITGKPSEIDESKLPPGVARNEDQRAICSTSKEDLCDNQSSVDPTVDLKNANLSGTSLQNANLWGASLFQADLSNKANLGDSVLVGATLTGARLDGANLDGANLYGAEMSSTRLCEASLRSAVLQNVDFSNADLSTARNLDETELARAKGNEHTRLPSGIKRPASWGEFDPEGAATLC